MNVLAIVPARGGSKGIPRKNLAPCAGRPLVDWTLQAATESRFITHRVLSSDDDEILDRGRSYFGFAGLQRPEELAQDDTATEPVMMHAIGAAVQTDLIVLLQPTSPLRTADHIDMAIALLLDSGVDSIVSVVPTHAYLWDDSGPLYTERLRRQDMKPWYEENGAIYVTTREQWELTGNRIGGRVALYVMDEVQRLQVDSPADLEMASFLLEHQAVPA